MARAFLFLLLATSLVLAAACSPGSSDDDSSSNGGAGGLSGTWNGTIENPSFLLGAITVVLDGSSITVTTPDGTQGGSFAQEQGNIHGFQLADGTLGGFMTDSAGSHAGFVDEEFYFGAVQKGASVLNTSNSSNFSSSDIAGSWSGTTVELTGADMGISEVYSSNASVGTDWYISGSDSYGSYSGSVQNYDGRYGRYDFEVYSGSETYVGGQFLTQDKLFAAGYSCPQSVGYYLSYCGFTIWNKQ